ncbi:MAG: zinc ribbon domain-containing protein [Anaerolineales bacterium]|nr:zinc ribbon domain-containing protein [Anaerolineales bacterium]
MPLYEYLCSNCGAEFDKMVRFSEADQIQACPSCQSQETHKKISRIAAMNLSSDGFSASASNCSPRGAFT